MSANNTPSPHYSVLVLVQNIQAPMLTPDRLKIEGDAGPSTTNDLLDNGEEFIPSEQSTSSPFGAHTWKLQ